MALNEVFSFKIEGGPELDYALSQLPAATSKAVLRRVLTQRLLPVAIAAQRLAPRSAGDGPHTRDSITVSTNLKRTQRRDSVVGRGWIQVFAGARTPQAHLIEFGTGPRFTKSGAYRGHTPARPFMRPAWDNNKESVEQGISADLWKEIARAARNLRRRSERYLAQIKKDR